MVNNISKYYYGIFIYYINIIAIIIINIIFSKIPILGGNCSLKLTRRFGSGQIVNIPLMKLRFLVMQVIFILFFG